MTDRSYSEYVFGKLLPEIDREIAKIIDFEEERQARKIIMIPSESLCPAPVLQALGSCFNNIYSEGYPSASMVSEDEDILLDFNFQLTRYRRYSDRRFYKGCDYVNIVETLAQRRAASLFATEKNPFENIYVNVQPLSGAAANNAVYSTFVNPGDVVMGMSLMHGGHLTHGSEFNRSGKNYSIVSYEVNPKTQKLDYDEIMALTRQHRPRMIIAGYTSYPWAPDWKRFREIADTVGAILLADISHPAGLIAAGVYPNPIDYADVITCTTHKTLFGPRGAIILTANKEHYEKIDQAIFPGEQGGPHVNKFAAMAVAFKIAQSREFKQTQKAIVDNAQYLGEVLKQNGLKLAYGGTDTHLLLVDLNAIETKSGYPLKGEIAVRILDLCGIVANKNTIPGDMATAEASGVRLGTPWITQRGITKEQIQELGSIIADVLKNIHPFTYQGLTGDLPRGKIELERLEDASRRVECLAKNLGSQRESKGLRYPHYTLSDSPSRNDEPDFMDKGVIEIRGERALQFIEEVSTKKITDLKPGKASPSFLFDKEGSLFAPIVVYRAPRKEDGSERFMALCKPEDKERIKVWFRTLSDGYALFDRDDIFAKIEGPVVVVDLKERSEDEKQEVVEYLKDVPHSELEFPDGEKGIDSLSLYKSYPQYFDLEKPYFIAQRSIPKPQGTKKLFTYSEPSGEPRQSVLHNDHLKLTNSIVTFAGWRMPVRYESTIEEHRMVREAAGLFDLSHMGVLEVSGEHATLFLDAIATNYVPWIKVGQSQYSYLLDIDGNIIDDIMVYRRDRERYMIVVNAVNSDKDLVWINAVNSRKVVIDREDRSRDVLSSAVVRDLKDPASGSDARVNLALQGPRSLDILKMLAPNEEVQRQLHRKAKNELLETELGGMPVMVSRTGYTGEEIGYELFVHPKQASALWNLILEKGERFGVKPIGLGARDSLRIEAGLPLYGHELAGPHSISPIEAGFGPYVKFHKPFFVGRAPLLQKMKQSKMEIGRFSLSSKGVKVVRENDLVVSKRSQKIIGSVTSCAVNQEGIQIGMAYIDKKFTTEGTKIGIISGSQMRKEKIKSLGDASIGDSISLHEEATIISRFPVEEE